MWAFHVSVNMYRYTPCTNTGSDKCFKRCDDTYITTGRHWLLAMDLPRGVSRGCLSTMPHHANMADGLPVHTASADLSVAMRRRTSLKTLPSPRGYKNLFSQTSAKNVQAKFFAGISIKVVNVEQCHLQVTSTECGLNRRRNVEITGINIFWCISMDTERHYMRISNTKFHKKSITNYGN